MSLSNLYREFMDLTMIDDREEKENKMRNFFERLNSMDLPEYFNWAEEV